MGRIVDDPLTKHQGRGCFLFVTSVGSAHPIRPRSSMPGLLPCSGMWRFLVKKDESRNLKTEQRSYMQMQAEKWRN